MYGFGLVLLPRDKVKNQTPLMEHFIQEIEGLTTQLSLKKAQNQPQHAQYPPNNSSLDASKTSDPNGSVAQSIRSTARTSAVQGKQDVGTPIRGEGTGLRFAEEDGKRQYGSRDESASDRGEDSEQPDSGEYFQRAGGGGDVFASPQANGSGAKREDVVDSAGSAAGKIGGKGEIVPDTPRGPTMARYGGDSTQGSPGKQDGSQDEVAPQVIRQSSVCQCLLFVAML